MTSIQAFIAISVILIALVTYSAIVVSSKQEQRMIQKERVNKLDRHQYTPLQKALTFEASEELEPEKDDHSNQL